MDSSFWVIALLCGLSFVQAQNHRSEPRCKVTRVRGMKAADCYQKDFRTFPKHIPTDVEILDLSVNRIRKFTKSDLKKYSYLKMLYLSDNKLQTIDEDVFEDNNELTTIDLSLNALSSVPPVIFRLPSLKSLYLGQNWNINIVDAVEKSKPIISPLMQLDISYIMVEEPGELPDLGVMPYLAKYNISGNLLTMLSTKHFAGLCGLLILDTTNVTVSYDNLCDCWTVNNWLKARKVKFAPFECKISQTECSDRVTSEDLKLYSLCEEKIAAIIHKSRMLKIFIPLGIIVLLVLIVIVYFTMRRRKQKSRRQKLKNHYDKTPTQTEEKVCLSGVVNESSLN